MAGSCWHFHPSQLHLKADPLLALTDGGRMENGIRNYLHYWQGKRDSANFSGHLPGSRKPQLHRSVFSSSCRLFTFLHKFTSILGKIYCNFPVNHVLTSLLAAPELSSDCVTRAADKRSCLLQQLLSAAPSHLLNRLAQICWRALCKAWLTAPLHPTTNHSQCTLCNKRMPSYSLGPVSTDSQARRAVFADTWMDKYKYMSWDQPWAFSPIYWILMFSQASYNDSCPHQAIFAEWDIGTGFCYWKYYEHVVVLKLLMARYYFAAVKGKTLHIQHLLDGSPSGHR